MESSQSDGQSEGVSAIGVLDVHVHQARDITNICIYHNQDVAAKLCLTNDPESTLSTQVVKGGGNTPVFNQTLRLNVQTVKCSLKCEVWMISQAKTILEDQLLGFTLVPLPEVILGNGKLEKEFALSSTDLFHSPAGFVHLSLLYTGSSPDVTVIPSPTQPVYDAGAVESLSCEFEKIEFPDPKIVRENHWMVSEYLGISRPEYLAATDSETESQSGSHPASFQPSLEIQEDSMSPIKEVTPPSNEFSKENDPRPVDSGDQEDPTPPESECAMPFAVSVENVKEEEVVAKDIVDMYMKSMLQFSESLAKMNLPLDANSGPSSSTNSGQNSQTTPKSVIGSRVFYGSRAFF